jgi:energy-coupling factor transport system ATP-binding protein
VLDEPTASLDVPGTNTVIATLRTLRQQYGITIILIEHRLAEAARLAERVVIMDQGKILVDGAANQVLAERELLRSLGLRRPTDDPPEKWGTLLTPNGHPPPGLQPLVEIRGLSAGYGHQMVLQDINLALYPGEFAALVGDNGAGKSTLALTAAGLLKPTCGSVRFNAGKRPRPGLDVSLLFQNPIEQLFTNSVEEEVAFGPQNYGTFTPEMHEKVLLEADLISLRKRRPIALSAGQQQRTAFAASLSLFPRLVILDEPTLGQDWGHLERLMDYLTQLNQQGLTILLITHDYKLVHRYARRVILLEGGRIALDGQLST